MTNERMIRLYSQGLLSKWGFSDGDVLDDPLWDLADEAGVDIKAHAEHPVLIRAVREYLLPVLEQSVEVYEIGTIHNPIRASAVDGVEIDDTADNDQIRLTPEYVDVPLDVLYGWWLENGIESDGS